MTVDQLKVTSQHLARKAVVYLRQSSPKQVQALVKKVVFDKPLIAAPQSEIETWH